MSLPGPKVWLPIGLIGAGALGALILVATQPAVSIQEPEIPRPLVRVLEVQPEDVQLQVRTHGTVKPRTESELVPEVAGPVVWVSPALVTGGSFEEGDPLLRIEPADYRVEVERARASLARTRSEHALARRNLQRRRDLAARNVASPKELDDAENAAAVASAAVREARAMLEKAERDLERTEISAPYAGRVREESVDVGQFVNRGARVATIYAVDYAEVRLPVPDRELAFVSLPGMGQGAPGAGEPGPPVLLHARFAGADHTWEGRVVRTEGEIDPRSRMIHVVARVEDPYGRKHELDRPPLAVGLFVEAEILGDTASRAFVLPRSAMRGESRVWIVDAEERLRFRDVTVLRAQGEHVVITTGLAAGDLVCLSPLQSAVDGMQVRAAAPRPAPGVEQPEAVPPEIAS